MRQPATTAAAAAAAAAAAPAATSPSAIPQSTFKFGLTWEAALAAGNVYNAMEGCAVLGITADEMDTQWGICKKAKKLVKFGGGFYCGLIEIEGKPSVYVFNGFFMSMRAKVRFEVDARTLRSRSPIISHRPCLTKSYFIIIKNTRHDTTMTHAHTTFAVHRPG